MCYRWGNRDVKPAYSTQWKNSENEDEIPTTEENYSTNDECMYEPYWPCMEEQMNDSG